MNRAFFGLAAAIAMLVAQPALAQQKLIATLEAPAGPPGARFICVPLSVDPAYATLTEVSLLDNTEGFPVYGFGTLTQPGLATEDIQPTAKGLVRRDLHCWYFPNKKVASQIQVAAGDLKKVGDLKYFKWE